MKYWGIAEARNNLTNNLGERLDKEGYAVIQDERSIGGWNRDALAVLVRPELFRRYQEIARWYFQREATRRPELGADVDLTPPSSFTAPVYKFEKSAIAQRLFQLIEQEQREDASRLPELSDQDSAALDASIHEVIRERESPNWSRPPDEPAL